MNIKFKVLLTAAVLFGAIGLLLIWQNRDIGKLRLIFCNVGQGDGILIVSPGGRQILIDGGPGVKITDCLSSYMPFWDRSVEMVFNTHPQQDHLEGLLEVLNRYRVSGVGTTGVANKTKLYDEWQEIVRWENAKVFKVFAGQTYKIDEMKVEILWPTQTQLDLWKLSGPSDLNESSIVTRVTFGDFCAYLTGDIPKEILDEIINKPCPLLKVAHHGSLTGTDEIILDKIKPKIAVIQVGKNNRYGHPKQEVLDILGVYGVRILRNDELGNIEIDTDGKSFWQVNIDQ